MSTSLKLGGVTSTVPQAHQKGWGRVSVAGVATPPLAWRAYGEPDWLTLRCYAYGHAFGVSGCFALRVYTRVAIKTA